MKKILFLIGSLGGGGAERVLITLSTELAQRGYDVSVQVIHNGGVLEKEVAERVKLIHIDYWLFKESHNRYITVLKNIIIRLLPAKWLYQILIKDEYDAEIAFVEGLSTKVISGSTNAKSKKMSWYHTNPFILSYSMNSYVNIKSEKKAYKRINNRICVSTDVLNAFEKKYEISGRVLLNPLPREHIIYKSYDNPKKNVLFSDSKVSFVSTGRLVKEKGYERLIEAVKRLVNNGFNVECKIIGTGRLEMSLRDQIEKNQLTEVVELVGFLENPYPVIRMADVFVCSSYTEGLSTAVAEAVILGKPIVTTDCAGMTDIIGDSSCALVVPNTEDGIYDGMKIMIQDVNKRRVMEMNSKKRGKYFDLNNSIDRVISQIIE